MEIEKTTYTGELVPNSLPAFTPRVTRRSARSVCFWYQSLAIAQAKGSCRYRIGNLVEHLVGANAIVGEKLPLGTLSHIKTLCVIRPLVTSQLSRQLQVLRQRGIRLVADYDDLLFAGKVSGLPSSPSPQRQMGYSSALFAFDRFTVSTRALARRLLRLNPHATVTVVPNGVSESWVRQGLSLYRPWQPGDELVVRYLVGSPSHDRDFQTIAHPLAHFLRDYPQVRLELVGPINVERSLFPAERLRILPALPHVELPRLLASSWVNLAPLEASDYSECRSAIKFLEAGAFGCPTLASPNDDHSRHQELGAPLLTCSDSAGWYQALCSLLDPERRMAAGGASAGHVMRHGMAADSAVAWFEAWERQ